jgi:hypothetical protein
MGSLRWSRKSSLKNPSAVKFYVDGKFLCDGKVADPRPFLTACQWKSDTVPDGDYMVTVKVFAPAGES